MSTLPTESARQSALAALDPRRWECSPCLAGWTTRLPDIGELRIASLGWQHAQTPARDGEGDGANALGLLVALQGEVWGMPPEETVPANLLAVLPETGGSVLVAYRAETGWTAEGWLGFALAAGARSGVLVSHMLGVRDGIRGGHGLGWLLKAVQGYEAVQTGHHAATWTFDPMRGANARLNVEKLGGVCRTLTVDKYGPLRSALYGDVPSDRLVATWDLLDPEVATRLAAVHDGSRAVLSAADLAAIPEAAWKPGTGRDSAATLRYEIPADIDRLTRDDPAAAARWRGEMRRVLGALLATERAVPGPGGDPLRTAVERTPGAFVVDGFASVLEGGGERRNHYLLSRRPIEEAPG